MTGSGRRTPAGKISASELASNVGDGDLQRAAAKRGSIPFDALGTVTVDPDAVGIAPSRRPCDHDRTSRFPPTFGSSQADPRRH
jgi:hypothetical protein